MREGEQSKNKRCRGTAGWGGKFEGTKSDELGEVSAKRPDRVQPTTVRDIWREEEEKEKRSKEKKKQKETSKGTAGERKCCS